MVFSTSHHHTSLTSFSEQDHKANRPGSPSRLALLDRLLVCCHWYTVDYSVDSPWGAHGFSFPGCAALGHKLMLALCKCSPTRFCCSCTQPQIFINLTTCFLTARKFPKKLEFSTEVVVYDHMFVYSLMSPNSIPSMSSCCTPTFSICHHNKHH